MGDCLVASLVRAVVVGWVVAASAWPVGAGHGIADHAGPGTPGWVRSADPVLDGAHNLLAPSEAESLAALGRHVGRARTEVRTRHRPRKSPSPLHRAARWRSR